MAEPNARKPWSTPRPDDVDARRTGFDLPTDKAHRVADRAQQSIDAAREHLAEENIKRKAEGQSELKPKINPWSIPRPDDEAADTSTITSREQAATVRREPSAQTAQPEAAPLPQYVDIPDPTMSTQLTHLTDLEKSAAMYKLSGLTTEEAMARAVKDANYGPPERRAMGIEERTGKDYREKFGEQIGNITTALEDKNSIYRKGDDGKTISYTAGVKKTFGEDSVFGMLADVHPMLFKGTMGALNQVMKFGGTVLDGAEVVVKQLNKNPVLRDRINAVYKGLQKVGMGSGELLTGDTVTDTKKFGKTLMAALEFSEMAYPLGLQQVGAIAAAAPKGAAKFAVSAALGRETPEAVAKRAAAATERARKAAGRRSPTRAMLAGSEVAEEASRLADEAAAANQDIAQKAIKEFEASLPKQPDGSAQTISMVNKRTGLLEIDPEKVRVLGKDRARQLYHAERAAELAKKYEGRPTKLQAALQQTEEAMAAGKFDERIDALTNPLLNPDKFNHIIGIASDLKKANPDLWDNSKTVIDNLFDLTVQKKLTGKGVQEIADTMNKYGFSFDDYVMTIVGTGSEAGKVLNKLSQIRRARPADELYESNRAAMAAMDGSLKNLSQRIENIRRGGMVSQIATAARNLTSAGIRMPLEALQNVAETAMYNFQHTGFRKGLGSVASSSTWKGAFKPFHHAFRNPIEAKAYVDLILNKKELAPTYNRLFGNLNEIQMLTGRGQATTRTGKVVDSVLSVGEDAVMDLNIFNRLQEFTVRRAMFLGQLENLTKREYGIDLIEALNEGKLTGLLNDSMRPQGKRSFHELIEDSTRLALDVTYAKQPDTKMGRAVANWITNASFGPARATWVLPFPRFMMNSLELIGQYAGGASIPLTKKFISLMKGGKASSAFDGIPEMGAAQIKLTTKDRQRISRNIAGVAAFTAAYQYRTMEDAPADYKMMKASDGTVVDTTPQFPMRQMLMVGEIAKQAMRGDIGEWLSRKNNQKELLETFLGTNIRTGTGAGLMTDLVEMVEGLGLGDVDRTDLIATEKAAKTLGRAIGSYAVSWLTPFVQLKEAQRWLGGEHLLGQEGAAAKWAGTRTQEFKDVAKDPKLDAPFLEQTGREIMRPLQARGFGLTPEEERALPKRVRIGQPNDKRMFPGIKALTGLSFRKRDSADMEYLHNLGYAEWTEGSKSKVPTIKRYENAYIQGALPSIVEILREQEVDLRADYKTAKSEYKKEVTEDQHVRAALRPLTNDLLQEERTAIAEASIAAYEGDDTAMETYHAQKRYRRLSKDRRNASVKLFYQTEGRWPVFTNSEDLESLSDYAIATGLGGSDSPLQN